MIKKNGFFLNYECEPFIKLEPSEKHIILFDHVSIQFLSSSKSNLFGFVDFLQ